MIFHQLFDSESSTFTYLVGSEDTKETVLIDPVRSMLHRDLSALAADGLELVYILETHIHADHVTGAWDLRQRTGAKIVMGARAEVDCCDLRLHDGDSVNFGSETLTVIETPGHTIESTSYLWRNRLFTGDCLFINGAGRADFQGGTPEDQWSSIRGKLFELPDETIVFPAHDYAGLTESTIGAEKANNPRIGLSVSREDYIRDESMMKRPPPKLMAIAIPANRRCGAEG